MKTVNVIKNAFQLRMFKDGFFLTFLGLGWELHQKALISYILQFIDSARFMSSPLSNLVNSLSEGLHRIKRKLGRDDKNCETCGIKFKQCDCFLEHANFKADLIEYKCLICNKIYLRKFNEKLKEIFFDTYKFSNHVSNKFKSCSVNLLYLMFNKMNGYFEEINGNKYLTLVPTNESKEKIE